MDSVTIYILLHIIAAAILLFAYVSFWFVVSLSVRRNDVMDLAWGLGIVAVAMYMLMLTPVESIRGELLAAMVYVWGLRLTLHIFRRYVQKPEDRRYAKWRMAWGKWFVPRSYAQVFLLQGALMLVVSYPFIHVNAYPQYPLSSFDVAGVFLWTIGLLMETFSDRSLRLFKEDPRNAGKVLDTGLWRYSRHPNYFGEMMQWWGIGVVLLAVPYGWIALVSPLMMTILLTKVSGVAMLERSLQDRPAYQAYTQRTSQFFPLPRKSTLVDKDE